MNLFPWRKKEKFFTDEEAARLVESIRAAEKNTSGEVRVFVESKCRFMDALDRAHELFVQLKMSETEQRNATLIYVAVKDRQAAVFGDEGIHQKVGDAYWQETVTRMLAHFRNQTLAIGIAQAISDLGTALQSYFPYDQQTDKNELPDEIIFGR